MAAIGPAFMLVTERYAPSFSGKGAFGPIFRLSCAIGLLAGAGLVYQRSCRMFPIRTRIPSSIFPGPPTDLVLLFSPFSEILWLDRE